MQRENVVNLNKGFSSRVVSEDKLNDNDIGSVELKVGPEGISSQLPEPLSVNTDKKGRNLGSKIEAHNLKKSWASALDSHFNSGEYNVENNSERCESLSEGENAKDLFEDLESWKGFKFGCAILGCLQADVQGMGVGCGRILHSPDGLIRAIVLGPVITRVLALRICLR
ncbi:hypothetical protein V6N13_104541 [Hibiscus sabdariffa]